MEQPDEKKIRKRKRSLEDLFDFIEKELEKKRLKAIKRRKNKNFLKFWDKYSKEISNILPMPKKRNYRVLKYSRWNSSSRRLGRNSWFTTEIQRPRRKSANMTVRQQKFLWEEIYDCALHKESEDEEKKRLANLKKRKKNTIDGEEKRQLKVIKIRIYPNKTQRDLLKRWFGTARWTYNQCLASIKKKESKMNKKELRLKFANSESPLLQGKKMEWVTKVPYDVRDEAINDLDKAFQSNFAKGPDHRFNMKFKSKKNDKDSIVILKKHWKRAGVFFPTTFGKTPLESSEPLPEALPCDSRLIRTRLNEYYLCIPKPIEIRPDNQRPVIRRNGELRTIALDPGVRTFNTGYDLDGYSYEWGKADIGRIFRLCRAHDKLQSQWSQQGVKHRERYKLKRAAMKIRKKIRNLVDDLHCKLVKWLCENHHVVLLPEFNTQRMIKRYDRKISSKTARK